MSLRSNRTAMMRRGRRRDGIIPCVAAAVIFAALLATASITRAAASASTDFLTHNSDETIAAMEAHLLSPSVQAEMNRIFQSKVEYDGMVHTYPSMKYSFDSFWKNWKRMMLNGVPTGSPGTGSGPGAEGKFVRGRRPGAALQHHPRPSTEA